MKVLISIDTSEFAKVILEEAATLLKGFSGAEAYVFNVIEMSMVALGHNTDETMLIEAQQQKAVELKLISSDILGDIGFTFLTAIGYPITEIISKAEELQIDLIIIGTHGRTGMDHLLIGSVAENVIRLASCNTFVIPMKKQKRAHH